MRGEGVTTFFFGVCVCVGVFQGDSDRKPYTSRPHFVFFLLIFPGAVACFESPRPAFWIKGRRPVGPLVSSRSVRRFTAEVGPLLGIS